jgi:hypothetical protein
MHARKHLTREAKPPVRKPGGPAFGPAVVGSVAQIRKEQGVDERTWEVGQTRSTREVREDELRVRKPNYISNVAGFHWSGSQRSN